MISRGTFKIAIVQPGSRFSAFALHSGLEEEDDPGDTAFNLVPPEYHDHLPMFSENEARVLPRHRYVDHAIPLVEGKKPPFGRMYSMSDAELKEVLQ